MKNYQQIEKLLSDIDIDVSLQNEDIETFEDLRDFLENNDSFNVEIIYYARAMEYLTENDTSLTDSLSLASDMGYDCSSLNSETLASILASQNVRNDFEELENEITELLDEEEEETEQA
jgi:hypothetical protein